MKHAPDEARDNDQGDAFASQRQTDGLSAHH
jgi:hypothetical protein